MKKKIAILISVFMMLFCLTACGGPTPTETVDSFLTAVKTQDFETIETVYAEDEFDILISEDDEDESEDIMLEEYAENFMEKLLDYEYTLANEQINDGKATVDVTFKTYPIGNAVSSWISEYFTQAFALAFSGASDEQLEELAETIFNNKINEMAEKTTEKTVTVSLTEEDGIWIIDEFEEDGDFYNAITGGMVDAINGINEIYGE